jgi:hypothetical protein
MASVFRVSDWIHIYMKIDLPKSALIYLAVVSIGFSQPLYNVVILFRQEFQIELFDVILIVFVFQFGVTIFLLLLRYALRNRSNLLDTLIYVAAMISIIRQIQQTYLETGGMSWSLKVTIAISFLIAAVLLVTYLRRYFEMFCVAVGWLAPVFGVAFIYQIATHDLPLENTAADQTPTSSGPPVILALFDEFSLPMILDSNGDIDRPLYPNFYRLSRMGVWYREAMANHLKTQTSFPSFMRSRYRPEYTEEIWHNINAIQEDSLLYTVKNSGYVVDFYSNYYGCSSTSLNCRRFLSGSDTGFLWNVFTKFAQEFGPDFLVDRYLPWFYGSMIWDELDYLDDVARNAAPGHMYFVHLMTSHTPYVFSAGGGYHFRAGQGSSEDGLFQSQGVGFDQISKNYAEQLQFVDRQLGHFLDVAEQSGTLDKAVVMILSDHGNCWTEDCPGRFELEKIRVVGPNLVNVPAVSDRAERRTENRRWRFSVGRRLADNLGGSRADCSAGPGRPERAAHHGCGSRAAFVHEDGQ